MYELGNVGQLIYYTLCDILTVYIISIFHVLITLTTLIVLNPQKLITIKSLVTLLFQYNECYLCDCEFVSLYLSVLIFRFAIFQIEHLCLPAPLPACSLCKCHAGK